MTKKFNKICDCGFPQDPKNPHEHNFEPKKNYDIPEILITVEGGVIQDVDIPKDVNIRVRIVDFDVDQSYAEENNLCQDEHGDYYEEAIWEN